MRALLTVTFLCTACTPPTSGVPKSTTAIESAFFESSPPRVAVQPSTTMLATGAQEAMTAGRDGCRWDTVAQKEAINTYVEQAKGESVEFCRAMIFAALVGTARDESGAPVSGAGVKRAPGKAPDGTLAWKAFAPGEPTAGVLCVADLVIPNDVSLLTTLAKEAHVQELCEQKFLAPRFDAVTKTFTFVEARVIDELSSGATSETVGISAMCMGRLPGGNAYIDQIFAPNYSIIQQQRDLCKGSVGDGSCVDPSLQNSRFAWKKTGEVSEWSHVITAREDFGMRTGTTTSYRLKGSEETITRSNGVSSTGPLNALVFPGALDWTTVRRCGEDCLESEQASVLSALIRADQSQAPPSAWFYRTRFSKTAVIFDTFGFSTTERYQRYQNYASVNPATGQLCLSSGRAESALNLGPPPSYSFAKWLTASTSPIETDQSESASATFASMLSPVTLPADLAPPKKAATATSGDRVGDLGIYLLGATDANADQLLLQPDRWLGLAVDFEETTGVTTQMAFGFRRVESTTQAAMFKLSFDATSKMSLSKVSDTASLNP